MFRVIFLIAIFIFQVWGIYSSVKGMIKPQANNQSINQLCVELGADKVAPTFSFFNFCIACLYAVVLSLNTSLIANRYIAVAFLILAALEICWFFIRSARVKQIYSGTAEEMAAKWKQYQRSWPFFAGVIFNTAETVFIGWGLYLILTSAHIVGR